MSWDAPAVLALIEKMRAHRGDFTGVEVTGSRPSDEVTVTAGENGSVVVEVTRIVHGERTETVEILVVSARARS